MRAYVIHQPGGPDALQLQEIPDPQPTPEQTLIKIKAFGLNRAEAVTRQGGSGEAVKFPRVIGIECVGEIVESPGGQFQKGQIVATMMGGLGRTFDGSYAELTVAPVSQIIPLRTTLPWAELAAIPETFLTAWGCLFESLKLKEDARVVMRPGASALGLAVTQIVNHLGGSVIGITRSHHKVDTLLAAGMKEVIVSGGRVADQVRTIWPQGATGIVETITSAETIKDDLKMKAWRGRLCIAGSLAASSGQSPGLRFALALIRPSVSIYSSETITAVKQGNTLQTIVERVEAGSYRTNIAAVIPFEELPRAHADIDASRFAGKVVVTLP